MSICLRKKALKPKFFSNTIKPRLPVSEARHRLVPIEGQKEIIRRTLSRIEKRGKKMKNKKLVSYIFLITFILAIGTVAISVCFSSNGALNSVNLNMNQLKVWYTSNSEEVNTIRGHLEQFEVETKSLTTADLKDNVDSLDFDKFSVILFDSGWLTEQKGNDEVLDLLQVASNKEAKLIAVGEKTSTFFEILDEAKVHLMTDDKEGIVRNPAHNEPAIVGFKLKRGIEPNGDYYYYPSIFTSNSEFLDADLKILESWIGG